MAQNNDFMFIFTKGSSTPTDTDVRVAVSDTGDGLSPDINGKVFDSFFTTKLNGLGIGLSISKTIVKAHQGHLWAENNDEAGWTFYFTLPINT